MLNAMNFPQARAISHSGLHIRRSAWADDKWFMVWRGTWFCFRTGVLRPVLATDYDQDDLVATDWTTMPAALAACPIDPTIGSTGGGSPTPGTDGFADDSTPIVGGVPGSGAPSGPDDPPVLPPPDPGTGVTVTFAGMTIFPGQPDFHGVLLNDTFALTPSAPNEWKLDFKRGRSDATNPPPDAISWEIIAARTGVLWSVVLTNIDGPYSGGFITRVGTEQPRGHPITNGFDVTSLGVVIYGGTATVN